MNLDPIAIKTTSKYGVPLTLGKGKVLPQCFVGCTSKKLGKLCLYIIVVITQAQIVLAGKCWWEFGTYASVFALPIALPGPRSTLTWYVI